MTAAAELAERAVGLCRADGCVVLVTEQSEANLRWAGNEVTSAGVVSSRRVTVVATVGAGVGVVSRTGDVARELADVVAAAEHAARAAEPAEDAAPLVADGAAPDWTAPMAETSMSALAGLAPALRAAFQSGNLFSGYAQQHARTTFLASSGGARLRTDDVAGSLELTGRSVDGQRSAWANASGDLDAATVTRLTADVTERLGWARRPVDLAPGRYEVLLPPAAVADLMTYAYQAMGGRDAAEGRSVYSAPGGGTRLNERLTPLPLTLYGDPAEPGLPCAPFVVAPSPSDALASVFDNGLPLCRTAWLDDGVLAALVQTRHSAARSGQPLTPPVDNLVLTGAGATGSLADLVARTRRGLLLTSLWYIREVDLARLLLTGLTRDGVYLVEDGEVVGAVPNFRFNVSPIDVLGRAVEVGATVPTRARDWADAVSRCAMPPLRVVDFPLTSPSRAI